MFLSSYLYSFNISGVLYDLLPGSINICFLDFHGILSTFYFFLPFLILLNLAFSCYLFPSDGFNVEGRKTIFIGILLACLILPPIEEAFFRYFLKDLFIYLGFEETHKLITTLIFGFYHSLNYSLHYNLMYTLYQIYHTTILGFFLANLHIKEAVVVHCLYNFIAVGLTILKNCCKNYFYPQNDLKCFCYIPATFRPKLKRSFSLTDLKDLQDKERIPVVTLDISPNFEKMKSNLIKNLMEDLEKSYKILIHRIRCEKII